LIRWNYVSRILRADEHHKDLQQYPRRKQCPIEPKERKKERKKESKKQTNKQTKKILG